MLWSLQMQAMVPVSFPQALFGPHNLERARRNLIWGFWHWGCKEVTERNLEVLPGMSSASVPPLP